MRAGACAHAMEPQGPDVEPEPLRSRMLSGATPGKVLRAPCDAGVPRRDDTSAKLQETLAREGLLEGTVGTAIDRVGSRDGGDA